MKSLYLFIVSFSLICCNSKENKAGMDQGISANKVFSFEMLDSIQIDYVGNPTVHDLDPVTRTVLFMEHKEFSEDIMVADFDGNVLNSFSKSGDMQDSYGSLMSMLRINGDNSFIAYGYNGFLIYDFTGKLQARIKLDDFQVPTFQMVAMGYGMEKVGNRYLHVDQGSQRIDYKNIDLYRELLLLNWLDPETGERKSFIRFPKASIFRSSKFFFRDSWAPVFTLADELIYVVFGIEPTIYIYETVHPYSLVSSIPMELPGYYMFNGGRSYGSVSDFVGLMTTSGRILNIKKVDGVVVVAYFTGYNEMDKREYFSNKSSEEATVFRERMQKKYPLRVAFLDSTGNRLGDFAPGGLDPSSMLLRKGELWMLEKPDEEVEQDFFRLFRVGLKFN